MESIVEQFDSRGFIAGVLRGARSFRIDETGHLTGVVYRQVWGADVNEAVCRTPLHVISMYTGLYLSGADVPHQLPEGHGMDVCRHGLYAYYDGSNDYHQAGYVSGVIEGFGTAMLGTKGFRCTKARIVALCLTEVKLIDRVRTGLVATNYPDIPMFNTFEQMVAEYPPDSGEDN